jgi:hypothetical protein
MTFKELKNGHVVKFKDGATGIVFKGFMTYDYILKSGGGRVARANNTNCSPADDIPLVDLGIVEVRTNESHCNDSFLTDAVLAFSSGKHVWKHEVVKEMTMAELEAKLGYKVKVVK